MTRLVVDASVAAKWLFQEQGSAVADRLGDPSYDLHAPDLMALEVAKAVWKRVRGGTLPLEEGRRAVEELRMAPVRWRRGRHLVTAAWEIAVRCDRTVYDGSYLALALAIGARLVTADRRFYDAAVRAGFRDSLLWLEDLAA
jgi:predicted nucleic acid-binding protein